jgi:cystathionine gamma-synthase
MSTSSVRQNEARPKLQFFRHVPCGARLPDTIHAVTVSMPALQDLIAYERGVPEALQRIQTGYPRFHTHPYIVQLQEHLNQRLGLAGRPLLIVSSAKAAHALCQLLELDETAIIQYKQLIALMLPEAKLAQAKALRQHIGAHVSSRQAEDFLLAEGLLDQKQTEDCLTTDSDRHVRKTLGVAYNAASADDIYLANAGMNAIYAAYQAINKLQHPQGRNIWIQFGWLFMDTMHLVEKLRATGTDYHAVYDVFNLAELRALLSRLGDRVAGIITEAPSNPLVRTPDVREIKRYAERYDCALLIDSTLGTPYNVDVLPHADLVIESLTKYASGSADVMLGAIVLNASSRFYAGVRAALPDYVEQPYTRDVQRLAFQIAGYAERMRQVNANTLALIEFLQTRQTVKSIFWAYQPESRVNYEQIHRADGSPGGIITLELHVPLATVYDRLRLAKGPSLGAEFTLVGPYLYHAHYDLVSSEAGRKSLAAAGLNPELLRISVGVEAINELIKVFAEAL